MGDKKGVGRKSKMRTRQIPMKNIHGKTSQQTRQQGYIIYHNYFKRFQCKEERCKCHKTESTLTKRLFKVKKDART